MLTFKEFLLVCEKKSIEPPNAVPGTYSEKDGVKTYTVLPHTGSNKPIKSAKKIKKMLEKQGGIGGNAVKKHINKVNKIKEDIEQRRNELKQRQLNQLNSHKERASAYQVAQKQKQKSDSEKEQLKQEIKRELRSNMN